MKGARDFLKNEKIDIVIYHSPCADGHAAAALFYFTDKTIDFYGMHPSQDTVNGTAFTNKNVVFVDIAFSIDTMKDVARHAKKVVVLDHHVTNQKTFENLSISNLRSVFDMTVAGVNLAWMFLHGEESKMPRSMYYIGLRDVWKHETDMNAVYFNSAFICPKRFEDWWPYTIDQTTDILIEEGRVAYQYRQSVLINQLGNVEYTTWRGFRIGIINVTFDWVSELGALICNKESKTTVAILWNKKDADNYYTVSLRSHNTIGPDVETIAREFGGGGHTHAAGLRMKEPPYEIFK